MAVKKCDVDGCYNRSTNTELIFFSLPADRWEHSKWLNKTFGDIGVHNPKCQTVCEIHVDPEFIRIVKARSNHKYNNKSKSSDPTPGPSVETNDDPQKTRKRCLPIPNTKSLIKQCKRDTDQSTSSTDPLDTDLEQEKRFESLPKNPAVTVNANMPSPKVQSSSEVLKREAVKTKLDITNVKMITTPKIMKMVLRTRGLRILKKPEDTNPTSADESSDVYEVTVKEEIDPIAVVSPYNPTDINVKVELSDPEEENVNSDDHFALTRQDNDLDVTSPEIKEEDVTYLIEDEEDEKDIKIENDEDAQTDSILSYQVKEQIPIEKTVPSKKLDFDSVDMLLKELVNRKLIGITEMIALAAHKLDTCFLKEEVPCFFFAPGTWQRKLKAFAITLYVYSGEAYEYIRTVYKTTLPDKTTVRDWLVTSPGYSGFTKETLISINAKVIKSKSPILVCLDIKEIKLAESRANQGPIRSSNPLDWSVARANFALVLTAVAINANWRMPIGYFWTNIVKDRANLVQSAICILEKVGVETVAVSFDYNDDNLQMCNKLSSNIACYNQHLRAVFLSESGKEILLFPDPRGILNKMYVNAVNIYNMYNIIDVDLDIFLDQKLLEKKFPDTAPQQCLRKTIATELFKNDCSDIATDNTIRFFKNLHIVLDLFSCRMRGLDFNNTCSDHVSNNLSDVSATLMQVRDYFKSLQIKDLSMRNCILGFCALIDSSLMFITKFADLRFQFSKFVGSTYFLVNLTPLGLNRRNPTALNFQKEYKAIHYSSLHCRQKITSVRNSVPLLKCTSPVDIINITTYLPNGNTIFHVVDDLKIIFGYKYTEYEEMIVVYIARFVTYSLTRRLKCELCIRALRSNFISKKMVSRFAVKLEEPSADALKICKKAELYFRNASYSQRSVVSKFNVPGLVIKVMKEYINRPLFEGILDHQYYTEGTCNHIVQLIKAVAELYLETRIQYYKPKNVLN